MKKTLFTVVMFTMLFASIADAQHAIGATGTNWKTTRYWDACKPSCGWSDNASQNPHNRAGTCVSCDVRGNRLTNNGTANYCRDNGTAFNCMGQHPVAVSSTLAYGFAASHTNNTCGSCYELTFTSAPLNNKKMVVMVTNIGGDVDPNQFDIMIPGGGVGLFQTALPHQISQNGGPNSPSLGARYGGFRGDGNSGCFANETCIRNMCDAAFNTPALENLKKGCYWYIDWYAMADNPRVNWTVIACPEALVTAYQTGRWPPELGGVPVTRYTITYNVNGGTGTAPAQQSVIEGLSASLATGAGLSRSGFTFGGWSTNTAGTGTNYNAGATFTPTGNTTLYARWVSNLTLTINRVPAAGGTVTGAGAVPGNTAVPITANAAAGYTFTGWTTGAGATIFNSFVSSTTVTLTANATITANFRGSGYTLTTRVSSLPDAGAAAGTVTRTPSNDEYSHGTVVTLTANPGSGHQFSHWIVTQGGSSVGNARTSPTTMTLTANTTVTAHFVPSGGGIVTPTTHSLTVNAAEGGTVSPEGQSTQLANTPITISASADEDYTFTNWTVTGSGTITTPNLPTTTVSLTGDATVTANFTKKNDGGDIGDIPRTDTTIVKASDATGNVPTCESVNNESMCVAESNSLQDKILARVATDNTATYIVDVPRAGSYTMQARLALDQTEVSQSGFAVKVNGVDVGIITTSGTGGWSGQQNYAIVELSSDVELNAGDNTVVLTFINALNLHYLLFLGAPEQIILSVKDSPGVMQQQSKPAQALNKVTLRAARRGFSAILPNGHSYTSYSLIDLQGREIQRGKVDTGISELHFSNIRQGVVFLRLKNKNNTTVIKATTF